MKKIFYILVALAILSALDNPVINQFYDDTIGQINAFARSTSKEGRDRGAALVYGDMGHYLAEYSEAEKAMIEKITQSNTSVLKFEKTYCINKDFNPVIYGAHQAKLCSVIRLHQETLKLLGR
jgi:hypothetical protein